jgi:sugar lactone lactonase YvrE
LMLKNRTLFPSEVKLKTPLGICFNPNDKFLYVCDSKSSAIKKISLQGKVSTVAKDIYFAAHVVSYHKENTLFVLQLYKNVVTKISPTGEVSTFARFGKAGAESVFCYPSGFAIDQQTGNLFFSEFWSHTVHMITPEGEVSQLAGIHGVSGIADGSKSEAMFNWPGALYFDEEDKALFVCDCNNDRIRRVSMTGDVTTVCRIKDPTCITGGGMESGVLLVGSPHYVFRLTKQFSGTYDVSVLKLKKKLKGQPLGIAVHESSCFVSESCNIRRISL